MSMISDTTAAAPFHPIGLVVSDDLHRSRLTVFFRWILVIPHLVVVLAWSILAGIVVFIAWIIGIFTGRLPEWFHDTLSGYIRYLTRVNAYLLLLANPWPTFGRAPYPVDVHIEPPAEQSRLTIAFLGWFYSMIFGRMSEGLRDTSAWLFKYELQTYAYIFLLTGRYPSLAGAPHLPTE